MFQQLYNFYSMDAIFLRLYPKDNRPHLLMGSGKVMNEYVGP